MPPLAADILGLGCVLPGAADCAQFADLLSGRAPLPVAQRQDLVGGLATGVFRSELDGPSFEARTRAMILPTDVAERMSRAGRRGSVTLRGALLAAAQAWTEAGQPSGETIGVILAGNNFDPGAGHAAQNEFEADGFVSPRRAVDWLDGHLLGVVSEVFGLTGPGVQVGGSSAAGLLGLLQASWLMRAGLAQCWLVVAPPMVLSEVELNAFAVLGALATVDDADPLPSPFPNPFDRETRGFTPSECAAAVMLGPPTDARFQVSGGASFMDGHGQAEPNAEGEARAMRGALVSAGLTPAQIRYVNSHGTGSPRGDMTEAKAICEVFRDAPRPAINATKGLIGHGLTSAGLVEVIATCLQMQAGHLHGNPGLGNPVDGPLDFIGAQGRATRFRHALCNSLAFGGINAAAVITDTHKEDE